MNFFVYNARRAYSALPYKRSVFKLLRRCFRLSANTYQHLHFVGPIEIPISSSINFKMHHFGAMIENDLFWAGYGNGYEATSLRLWVRLAYTANAIFDIGANTGVYALAAKAVNSRAQVFAFEPVTSIAARLKLNIELNDFEIEIVHKGVSSSSGTTVMYIPSTTHSYSASLNVNMLGGQADVVETVIQTVRIDSFMEDCQLASTYLFKIDTEKHEVDVLLGFGDIIKKFRPAFLMEILDEDLGKKIEPFFSGLGYAFFEIIEGKEVRRVGSLGTSSNNYLICPTEYAELNRLDDVIRHDALYPKSDGQAMSHSQC